MYIVKVGYKSDVKGQLDGYTEVETEQQAIDLYTEVINKYPSFKAVVMKAEVQEMPTQILEDALLDKKEKIWVIVKNAGIRDW